MSPYCVRSQESKQINDLSRPTHVQIGSTHSWPDSFKNSAYFESLTSQAGMISHEERGNLRSLVGMDSRLHMERMNTINGG